MISDMKCRFVFAGRFLLTDTNSYNFFFSIRIQKCNIVIATITDNAFASQISQHFIAALEARSVGT